MNSTKMTDSAFPLIDDEELGFDEVTIKECKALPFYEGGLQDFVRQPKDEKLWLNTAAIGCFLKHRGEKLIKCPPFPQIVTLPLEIQLEIFRHLHPIDLLNLSLTDKTLHQVLRSEGSKWIWEASFYTDPDLPQCPPNVSILKWISLLLGSRICDTCDREKVEPSFAMGIRCCTHCWDKQYTHTPPKGYEQFQSEIFNLMPSIYPRYDNGLVHEHWVVSKRMVKKVAKRVAELHQAIREDLPNAAAEYEAYKDTMKKIKDETREISINANWWAVDRMEDYEEGKLGATYMKVIEMIQRRLIEEGFHDDDVYKSGLWSQLYKELSSRRPKARKLTPQLWLSLYPSMTATLHNVAINRQLQEKEVTIESRWQTVAIHFKQYQKRQPNSTWTYRQNLRNVKEDQLIRSFVFQPNMDPLSQEQCDQITELFPRLEEEYVENQRANLIRQLRSREHIDWQDDIFPSLPPVIARGCNEPSPHTEMTLHSAAAVFVCGASWSPCTYPGPPGLIGWEEAKCHTLCKGTWDNMGLRLSGPGHLAAVTLLECAGLDVYRTLPSEFDELRMKFVCDLCGPGAIQHHAIFDWRRSINHHILFHWDQAPRWSSLPSTMAEYVVKAEQKGYIAESSDWACNHCDVHHECLSPRLNALLHVQAVHGILAPSEGRDIVFLEYGEKLKQIPATYSPAKRYICRECRTHHRAGDLLYYLHELIAHLEEDHGGFGKKEEQLLEIPYELIRHWVPDH